MYLQIPYKLNHQLQSFYHIQLSYQCYTMPRSPRSVHNPFHTDLPPKYPGFKSRKCAKYKNWSIVQLARWGANLLGQDMEPIKIRVGVLNISTVANSSTLSASTGTFYVSLCHYWSYTPLFAFHSDHRVSQHNHSNLLWTITIV